MLLPFIDCTHETVSMKTTQIHITKKKQFQGNSDWQVAPSDTLKSVHNVRQLSNSDMCSPKRL